MSVAIHTMTIAISGGDAAKASFRSVLEQCAAIGDRLELVVDLDDCSIIGGLDAGDLLRCETVGLSAAGAGKLEGFQILPGDGYLEFAAAVARRVDCDVAFSHGWPVLSLRPDSATIAEAGAGAILPGGGIAA